MSLAYPVGATVPLRQQEQVLGQLATRLRAAGLPVVLMRQTDGADIPFMEVACEVEHHRAMLLTLAAMDQAQREAMMLERGILPSVAALTQDACRDDAE